MKKTLSIILAILMIATTIPFSFAADDYAVIDTETGTVTIDGTLGGKTTATEDDVNALVEKIKGYVGSGITTIIVTGSEPALHNFYGIDTSAVSAALYYLADNNADSPYCGTIDLILPDVTEIVDDEFNNTFALNSITLPKVTKLGNLAFYAAIYLQTITFGSVLTEVNETGGVVFYQVGKEVGGCDLVLNCGQMDSTYIPNIESNTWTFRYENEFKSITLTHTGGEATCVAKAVCETCGEEYGEADPDAHIWKFGECTECEYVCEHSFTNYIETKAPTCTEAGREDSPCDYCDAMDYNTIPELNHKDTLVQVEAKAKTCTEIGWDAYEYCTECDYTTYKEIPSNGHTPLEAVKENEVAPKCGVAGSYDLVVYCDVCGEELDRDTTTVDALTHTDADGDYLCDNGCGYEYEKPVDPTPDTPDTPDEPTDDVCEDCGKVHTNFFSEIICFFTRIINFIKNLFT